MAERLLFMDVAKGLAILGVLLNHILVLGVWFNPGNALAVLPIWVLILISPLVIIATWGGFFELMSGLSNMYNMYDRIVVKEQTFKRAVQGPFVNSTALIATHFLFVSLFAHRRNAPYPRVGTEQIHTLITGSIELGEIHATSFQYFYYADILGSIGLAGYLSIIMIWILHKMDLLDKPKKASSIIFSAGILFWIASYPIWDWGFELTQDLLIEGSLSSLILAKPLSMLTGSFQPFFPVGGYAFLGTLLGLLLGVEYHKKIDPQYYENRSTPTVPGFVKKASPVFFVSSIILLILYLNAGNPPAGILDYYRIPPPLLAFNTSLMLILIRLGIKWFEEPEEEVRLRRAQKTLFIRRLGLVTLSIYVFESVFNGIISYFFHKTFDDPTTPEYESHVATIPIFGYIAIVFGFWFLVVPLWEKVDFKYSLEYFIVNIGSRFRPSKSSKLDYERILYKPYRRSGEHKLSMVTEPQSAMQD